MARSFNGTTALVNVGNASALQITGRITLAARVNVTAPTSTSLYTIIAAGFDGSTVPYYLDLYGGGGGANPHQLRTGQYPVGQATVSWSPTAGTWYSVVGLHDGSIWKLYIDAAFQASGGTTGAAAANGQNHSIGARIDSGTPSSFFNGKIAEVAVWNTNIPVAAIAALAAGAPPWIAAPDGLKGYWPLLGDSSEPDYSGTRSSGTVTAATVVAHPGIETPW